MILLSSCTISQKIFIKLDGSADVISSEDEVNQIDDFYKSDQITNLSRGKKAEIIFTIKTIDSLGNYLSPLFEKNIFEFKYNEDTLSLTQSEGEVFKTAYKGGCNLIIEITAYKKIKSIQTQNLFVMQKGNKVVVQKSKHSFNKKDENINLIIVFEK